MSDSRTQLPIFVKILIAFMNEPQLMALMRNQPNNSDMKITIIKFVKLMQETINIV